MATILPAAPSRRFVVTSTAAAVRTVEPDTAAATCGRRDRGDPSRDGAGSRPRYLDPTYRVTLGGRRTVGDLGSTVTSVVAAVVIMALPVGLAVVLSGPVRDVADTLRSQNVPGAAPAATAAPRHADPTNRSKDVETRSRSATLDVDSN